MTGSLKVTVDTSSLSQLGYKLVQRGARIRSAIRMAVNEAGDRTAAPMRRALVTQTGLKPKVIKAALKTKRASDGLLAFEFRTRGGNIRLAFFAARETRRGVSAAPRGQRRVFPSTFIHGGRFPNRHGGPGKGFHAYERTGRGRFPIRHARSGVFIPEEMVTGATATAFKATTQRVLSTRLDHHVKRALGGK